MKIVIAPDSFKGTLTAVEVAEHIRRGLERGLDAAECLELPLSDGGEGFVDTMAAATDGEIRDASVHDPLGRTITARYALIEGGRTAVIEMAAASGLGLLEAGERNPLQTSTVGTGELIGAALDSGAERLLIGIGGSATVDGGAGMADALGFRFLSADGTAIAPVGGELGRLASIDATARDARLDEVAVEVACDVDNPLTGPEGAAAVFGPQKGATAEAVEELDANLGRLAQVMARDLGSDVDRLPGAGAAGGLGGGLVAFLGAELRSGVEMVLDHVGFDRVVRGADLVITGEGRLDRQSLRGKLPIGVARRAERLGRPVIAIAGALGNGLESLHLAHVDCYFSVVDRVESESEAFARSADGLERVAEQVARALALGSRLPLS